MKCCYSGKVNAMKEKKMIKMDFFVLRFQSVNKKRNKKKLCQTHRLYEYS